MPELNQKPEPFRRGQQIGEISAENLNKIVETVLRRIGGGANTKVHYYGDRISIESGKAIPVLPDINNYISQFVVLDENDDWLLCTPLTQPFDSNTGKWSVQGYDPSLGQDSIPELRVWIAKPYHLQKKPWDGATVVIDEQNVIYNYTGVGHRTYAEVIDPIQPRIGLPVEQSIDPAYVTGDVIQAVRMVSGLTDPINNSIAWMDINAAGRSWKETVIVSESQFMNSCTDPTFFHGSGAWQTGNFSPIPCGTGLIHCVPFFSGPGGVVDWFGFFLGRPGAKNSKVRIGIAQNQSPSRLIATDLIFGSDEIATDSSSVPQDLTALGTATTNGSLLLVAYAVGAVLPGGVESDLCPIVPSSISIANQSVLTWSPVAGAVYYNIYKQEQTYSNLHSYLCSTAGTTFVDDQTLKTITRYGTSSGIYTCMGRYVGINPTELALEKNSFYWLLIEASNPSNTTPVVSYGPQTLDSNLGYNSNYFSGFGVGFGAFGVLGVCAVFPDGSESPVSIVPMPDYADFVSMTITWNPVVNTDPMKTAVSYNIYSLSYGRLLAKVPASCTTFLTSLVVPIISDAMPSKSMPPVLQPYIGATQSNVRGFNPGNLQLISGYNIPFSYAPFPETLPLPSNKNITSSPICTPLIHYRGDCDAITTVPTCTASASKDGLSVAYHVDAAGGKEPYSYLWYFEDGSTFAGQDATFTYAFDGNHKAIVVVTDANGMTCSRQLFTIGNECALVAVEYVPGDQFYFDPVQFRMYPGIGVDMPYAETQSSIPVTTRVIGTNIVSWYHQFQSSSGLYPWTFRIDYGDGNIDISTGNTFASDHSYSSPGTYTAVMQVTDAAGVTVSKSLTVVLK